MSIGSLYVKSFLIKRIYDPPVIFEWAMWATFDHYQSAELIVLKRYLLMVTLLNDRFSCFGLTER